MARIVTSIFLILITALVTLSSCVLPPSVARLVPSDTPQDPGLAQGFYQFNSVTSESTTETATAKRLSIDNDIFYVYKVSVGSKSSIVLGLSKMAPEQELDQVSRGIFITVASAKQLGEYLGKVITSYESKDKNESVYIDFRVTVKDEIETVSMNIDSQDTVTVPIEYVQLRFQYNFNKGVKTPTEHTTCYLKDIGIRKIRVEDLKALRDSLSR